MRAPHSTHEGQGPGVVPRGTVFPCALGKGVAHLDPGQRGYSSPDQLPCNLYLECTMPMKGQEKGRAAKVPAPVDSPHSSDEEEFT